MRNATRLKYNAYTAQIGKLNAVEDPSRSFTVAPAVAQTLRGKIQQSSAFLTSINIIPVHLLAVRGTCWRRSARRRSRRRRKPRTRTVLAPRMRSRTG